jgi:hypothetical protein
MIGLVVPAFFVAVFIMGFFGIPLAGITFLRGGVFIGFFIVTTSPCLPNRLLTFFP